MTAADVVTLARTHAGAAVNRTWTLPIAVVCPTGRCNSRCMSCSWWATSGEGELTAQEFADLASALRAMGTRLAVFSGGEPLLREDLWTIARAFRHRGIVLHLLTSGLALKRDASKVARYFSRVIVSLDGADAETYRSIRGVDGYAAVAAGVAALKSTNPGTRITARVTLHRANFRDLIRLVDAALAMGVQQVSFLAADLGSGAFGPRNNQTLAALPLNSDEVREFRGIVETCIAARAVEFWSGFIAESPERLRRLPQYYAAHLGEGPFPANRCNAPSVSVVVEADGTVRPCFFHEPVGNLRQHPLEEIVSRDLAAFRAAWRPSSDAICERCVCTLNLGWGTPPWS
ncbi:MAG TPA: radical SAM protein [Vicinamibacterales bacterium]|nr:radical SAM protein [Vicinamibacterales bacterium]